MKKNFIKSKTMKKNLLTAAIVSGMLLSTASKAQTLYGITTDDNIFTMSNVNTPSVISGPYAISGVATGQVLVGIDSRPGNGALYALGYDSVTQMAELYMINASGTVYTATAVSGTLASMNLGSTNNAAFDFISTADNQIRVVGRNGNNYLMNAVTGTVTSTGTSGLSFAGGDIYSGLTSALAATAYTNSFFGADATDEVGYDAANNVLVTMDAGNYANGFVNTSNTLHSIGTVTGVVFSTGGSIGMDAWYDATTHANTIFMSGSTLLAGAHLYKYDMTSLTGTLTDLGAIGSGSLNVRDIALSAQGSYSGSLSQKVTGLSLNLRKLITFDALNPSYITNAVALTGMTTGQTMIGIDYAANGALYGLGYNSGSHTYQLYTIDSLTGAVTAVNATPISLNLGTDDGSGNYVNASLRFIPTAANRIRVLGNNGSVNVQLDATTGAVVATDTALSYVTGDLSFGATANVTSVAYTGFSGDTATHMFGFDANTGAMIMFDQADLAGGLGIGSSGYINTDLSLSSVLSLFAHTAAYNNAYMNIAYDAATAGNIGFMASNYIGDSASAQQNYAVVYDLSSMLTGYHKGTAGTPTPTGTIGYGTPVKDIAIRRTGFATGFANITNNADNALLIYPNPVLSNTHIVLPTLSTGVVTVDIIDMNGRVDGSYQYAAGATQLDLDMSTLHTGLYSVRVFDPAVGYYNLKVVKE